MSNLSQNGTAATGVGSQANQQYTERQALKTVINEIKVGKQVVHKFEVPDFGQLAANFISAFNDIFEESARQFAECSAQIDYLTGKSTNVVRVSPTGVFLARMMMNNLHTNLNSDYITGDVTRLSLYSQEGKWHSVIRECVAKHTKKDGKVVDMDALNNDADYVEANLQYQRAIGQREMTQYLLEELKTWHKEMTGADYVPILIQRKETGQTATKAAMVKAQLEKNGFNVQALRERAESRLQR